MLDGKWIHSVSPELMEDVAMWQCNVETQFSVWYIQQLLWSLSQVNFTGSFLIAIQHWFRQCPGIARQQVITFKQNRLSYLTPYGVISIQVMSSWIISDLHDVSRYFSWLLHWKDGNCAIFCPYSSKICLNGTNWYETHQTKNDTRTLLIILWYYVLCNVFKYHR